MLATFSVAALSSTVFAEVPARHKARAIHSAAQLAEEMRKLEAPWGGPGWNQLSAHKKIRNLVNAYVAYQLNRGSIARGSLEKNLADAIRQAMRRSWAEHPARVLRCGSDSTGFYVVAFILDEAAVGSTSVIQIYKDAGRGWALTSEGGSEMNDANMDVLLLPFSPNEGRLFTYGMIFGANQGPTKAMLYSLSAERVRPIWKMSSTLGLSAKIVRDHLVLRYRDTKLFYAHREPDAFRDVYVQSDKGLKLLSHKPLLHDEQ